MAITGIEFKHQYGNTFYKFLNKELNHYGFQYDMGLNVDTETFNPTGECRPGGIYFSSIQHLLRYYSHGSVIGIIEVPDDAKVYIEAKKFKADMIIIKN